ncbi:hypothetical protein B1748_23675 [Paenibacillus sp. MY03]|uniref:hypothetical protein n=1 Tax=Paenibacillus sp. MY03 TaxID=302980 RepID=UPI000B3D2E1D|nr:hypothetical protein [Paenibacillus sp. MY03]OUS73010.1 hypothetical protein B1748_23675 [Paenibacillus sp. MY03]
MKTTKKQKLAKQCKDMLKNCYSDGGIASDNEYNQFLCDYAPDMVQYMSVEGLLWLKDKMDRIYENTLDSDKAL